MGWIETFITGRTQQVVVGNKSWFHFLLAIYINDLPNMVCSEALLFADDTKIFRIAWQRSPVLQQDLDKLMEWSDKWLLTFHQDKCEYVHITRACFLYLARSKLRLCSANHRAGYFSNLACDWLSIVWAYSEQETENGPRNSYELV